MEINKRGKAYQYYAKDINIRQDLCDKGDLYRCSDVQDMVTLGYGIKRNSLSIDKIYKHALKFTKDKCSNGSMFSCRKLTEVYNEKNLQNRKENLKKLYLYRLKILSDSCNQNNLYDCTDLGDFYRDEKNPYKDLKKSKQIYKKLYVESTKLAKNNKADGYYHLAYIYAEGRGKKVDQNKAIQLAKKSCKIENKNEDVCPLLRGVEATLMTRIIHEIKDRFRKVYNAPFFQDH